MGILEQLDHLNWEGGEQAELRTVGFWWWIVMIGVPMVALIPDCIYTLTMRVFYPNPTDFVMLEQ